MKKSTIIDRIEKSGWGVYDARKYRYTTNAAGELIRCEIAKLGTAAALEPGAWQKVK